LPRIEVLKHFILFSLISFHNLLIPRLTFGMKSLSTVSIIIWLYNKTFSEIASYFGDDLINPVKNNCAWFGFSPYKIRL